MSANSLSIVIPETAELIAAARMAAAKHLMLITNDKATLLSPIMLPGYRRMRVNVKTQVQA